MTTADPLPNGAATILIVDDHAENLRLLSQMLIRAGYRVRVAKNGARALESVYASPPDLVLLDIMMPDMDGYAVCEHLKSDIADGTIAVDIPVLFISALNEAIDKMRAFSVGGVDYITKPFQVEEVLARVQTHLTLRRLRLDLEARVAELDAFAHTVAHDLKDPLSVITSYADLLQEAGETLTPELQAEATDAIAQMGYKMAGIIDTLLLLASVRQRSEPASAPLDMGDIVADACRRLTDTIKKHGAEIDLPDAWPPAEGYGPWVEEVWANLISNAVKYGGDAATGTPAHITLGAEMTKGGTSVRFWVRDNGPGIAPELQDEIFNAHTHPAGMRVMGHGLGLSIVRRIVERLGGAVGVESAPGEGSTFTFTLPAAVGFG